MIRRCILSLKKINQFRWNNDLVIHVSIFTKRRKSDCTYLEIQRVEFFRLVSNDKGNSMRKHLLGVTSRTGPIAMKHPFIQLGLDPRDSKPSEDEAEI